MFKVIALLKRKSGMTMEEFIAYYENHHAKLGERYLTTALAYSRQYLRPVAYPLDGSIMEPEYDVLTEVSYADRAAYEEGFGRLGSPDIAAVIVADEEKLFDRAKSRLVFVEECRSDMTRRNTTA